MVLEPAAKECKALSRTAVLTLPDLVVLSLLSERPMHGYQLVSELERRDVQDWAAISRPQVYYSLKKLLKQKLTTVASDGDPSLGPEKVTHKISASGKLALEANLSRTDWAIQRPPPPFQTWMALSAHLPKSAVKSLFAARRSFLQKELKREQKTLLDFDAEVDDDMAVAGRLMVGLCIKMFELELDWLDDAEPRMLARR